MIDICEYVDIKDYSTLRIGGKFRYFIVVSSIRDLVSLYNITQNDLKFKNIPIFVLGGGSNIVFSDGVLNVLAVKIEIKGFDVVNDSQNYTDIKVGSGEIWDEFVEKIISMDLFGLESLSAIPGTVGATPVQNVGAYGSEVKDVILEVEVFSIKEGTISKISNKDCEFGYRDSIFKNEAKGKYIITSVVYRLLKNSSEKASNEVGPIISKALSYPGVLKYFEDREIDNPTLKQIRDAIIFIRSEKLPNPKEIPNVGSFFKNPIVPNDVADEIKNKFPNAKFFFVNNDFVKIPAGWLIENSGLKGKSFGKISVYDRNALVLVNADNASYEDVISARNEIIKTVKDKFDITLEQEPEIV